MSSQISTFDDSWRHVFEFIPMKEESCAKMNVGSTEHWPTSRKVGKETLMSKLAHEQLSK